MSAFNKAGDEIFSVFDVGGIESDEAFDVAGNPVLQKNRLVVMSYNYQWCNGINSQLVMQQAIMDKYSPDIIGLQEAGINNRNATAFPALANQFLSGYTKQLSTQATNRNGIASKIPYTDFQSIRYTENDDENWDYSKCYIEVDGKRIAWFNTHFTYRNNAETRERKHKQAKELFEAAELEDYAILTGDFNMFDLSFDSDDYIGIGKQFADAGYHLANWNEDVGFVKTGTVLTYATSLDQFLYASDNIIVSPNITIDRVVFDTTKLSYLNGDAIDHIPVVAWLRFADV